MRLLHTSDWHLGRSFHGVGILEHQRAFIAWLVALVEAEEVDAVLIAGDVFDRAVPPLPAVDLWERALLDLRAHAAVIVTSGNHDSPTRLGFAGPLLGGSGIHLRTRIGDIGSPVDLRGRDGLEVAAYGLPYLEPDLHRVELGAQRSHAAVLTAALDRVRRSISAQPDRPSVALAHAFITGSGPGDAVVTSDSERDLRVGGIADAPASIFEGIDYVALGHLHGAQRIRGPAGTTVAYSGSPLAFSFSEQSHVKSVTLVDIGPGGVEAVRPVPVPVPRRLTTLRGRLEDLLDDPQIDEYSDDWARIVLTDARRPDNPMGRIRVRLPHAVELVFEPAAGPEPSGPGHPGADDAAAATARAADPVALAESFVRHVTNTEPTPAECERLRDAVETVRISGTSR